MKTENLNKSHLKCFWNLDVSDSKTKRLLAGILNNKRNISVLQPMAEEQNIRLFVNDISMQPSSRLSAIPEDIEQLF